MANTRLTGVALIVVLLVLWELSWRLGWIEALSWPAMSAILRAGADQVREGDVFRQVGITGYRLAAGYVLAAVVGIAVGVLMGSIKAIYSLLEPITELLRPIPTSALIPVAILFFGIHDKMKIAMIFYAALWPILLNTYNGVRNIDRTLIDTGRTFGCSPVAMLLRIRFPAAAPYIASGLRISLAVALVVAVVAEMIAGGDGIGAFLLLAQRTFRVPDMYVGIIILALLGYTLNWLFVKAERRIVFWSAGSTFQER